MHIESFTISLDINGDGIYSRWEVWEAIAKLYRLPGNLIVEGLGNIPYVSDLLGIKASAVTGYASLNGALATSLSLLIWLAALCTVLSLSSGSGNSRKKHPKKPDVLRLSWTPKHKPIARKHHNAYH